MFVERYEKVRTGVKFEGVLEQDQSEEIKMNGKRKPRIGPGKQTMTLLPMNKYFFRTQTLARLAIVIFAASSFGQVPTNGSKDHRRESQTITKVHSKLIKTQGSDQYANIHCSLEDKIGNLWFGTIKEGIYRYDGNVFTQFTKDNGLSSNTIWSIWEDHDGNIWAGTDAGVCRYDGEKFTSIPIIVTNAHNLFTSFSQATIPVVKNDVWCMMQDKKGIIWFGTTNDVYCYQGRSFSRFLDNDSIINKAGVRLKWVQSILEDKSGIIWFGSGPIAMEGVCRYDGKTFSDFTEKKGLGSPMLTDKAGNIWFDGGERLNSVESDGGIWRYNGKSFTNFTAKNGLGRYSVWSMVEDRAGNVWVGTRNNGLYRYDGKTFTSFSE